MNWRQTGQSMTEYVIVCAGLISALTVAGTVNCGDNGKTKLCVSDLLTVMHDNYDGYSSSISAVQKYGDYAAAGEAVNVERPGVGGGPNTGGGGGGGSDDPFNSSLKDATEVLSTSGATTHGIVSSGDVVIDTEGNFIGDYSETDSTIDLISGGVESVTSRDVVLDEENNILHLRAVTSCDSLGQMPVPVYSWGYESTVSGKVFNSVSKEEMAIDGQCTQPTFRVVKDGEQQGGRILNSEYFAAVYALEVSDSALPPTGDVIYWDELGLCTVMIKGWDAAIDVNDELDDDEYYQAQKALIGDDDYYLGEIDDVDYISQTTTYGVASVPNDCPTSNIISAP